jgi:hypothetical protein
MRFCKRPHNSDAEASISKPIAESPCATIRQVTLMTGERG